MRHYQICRAVPPTFVLVSVRSMLIFICSQSEEWPMSLKKSFCTIRNFQRTQCAHFVTDGICVDPPLWRGTSHGKYGSMIIGFVWRGETVGKIGEVDEMGERELVLEVSVRCGKEWDRTRRWQLFFKDTKMCNPELCSSWATRVRVMKCDHAVQLCACCSCGLLFTHLKASIVRPTSLCIDMKMIRSQNGSGRILFCHRLLDFTKQFQ